MYGWLDLLRSFVNISKADRCSRETIIVGMGRSSKLPSTSTSLKFTPFISNSPISCSVHWSNRSTPVTLGVYSISCSACSDLNPSSNSVHDALPTKVASWCSLWRQTQNSGFWLEVVSSVGSCLRNFRRRRISAFAGGERRVLESFSHVGRSELSSSRASCRAAFATCLTSERAGSGGREGWEGRIVNGWGWSWMSGIFAGNGESGECWSGEKLRKLLIWRDKGSAELVQVWSLRCDVL